MASEHKRIVDRLEALERLVEDDKGQRRIHCDQHNRLEERQKALEESVSLLDKVAARKPSVEAALAAQLSSIMKAEKRIEALEARADRHDHAHDTATRLRDAPENRINARLDEIEALMDDHSVSIHGLSEDVDALEARLSSKPDDFGGVTSTGAPKPMKRWVLTSNNGRRALHSWGGVMWRRKEHPPVLFATKEGAALVRDLLFQPGDDVCLEEVEVVDRDGRLVEARYVS